MSMYPDSALRRAMKIQEIILRAMSGEITWIKAAMIIGVSAAATRLKEKETGQGGSPFHGQQSISAMPTASASTCNTQFDFYMELLSFL